MAKMTSIIAASSFRGAPSANRESTVPTLEGVSLDDHSRNRGYGFRLLLASALGRNDERPSERNLVVHIAAAHRSGHGSSARRRRDLAGRARRAEIAAAGFVHVAAAASARAPRAIEQRQLAAKVLQHDFGGIAVLTGLILPFARLQRALDVNLRALLEILLGDPAQVFIEDDDAMPFGFFAPLAGTLVLPGFRSGEPQICDRPPVLGATDFGIGAQIADQDHLVDASRHATLRFIAPMFRNALCLVTRYVSCASCLATRHVSLRGRFVAHHAASVATLVPEHSSTPGHKPCRLPLST